MNFKRIGRILVCLLLVCCLIVNISPIRAKATGVAAGIVAASSVFVPPAWAVYATLAAIGIYAGVESGAFEQIGQDCITALEAAGTWIQDSAVELLRTVDSTGQVSYYVDSGLVEDVRSWVYDSSYITATTKPSALTGELSDIYDECASHTAALYYINSNGYHHFAYCDGGFNVVPLSNGTQFEVYPASGKLYIWENYSCSWSRPAWITMSYSLTYQFFGLSYAANTTNDLSLGVVPSIETTLTDGTSARAWSEDYTDRGLKVYGGGSGNDNNDGKWFWKLMLPLTAAELLALSQADEWSAETPAEFAEYTTNAEYEILSQPEVEFGTGLEISPASGGESGDDTGDDSEESTEPTTDTGGVPDTGGDTGSDTGTESGNQTDYTSWFERIIKGIEELPTKFETWITDCKTAIEELPSKFATWFDSIIEKLSSIWESLQTISSTIINGIKSILSELFAPSADYIANKVSALHEKYPYLDHFQTLGTSLKDYLTTLGASPPIIYIDLGAARNSYVWGGKQIFIDLTWYAEYKPTMDFIISAFLWLWFAFRLWQSAPGILQGTSGMWGDGNTVPDLTFHIPKYQQGTNWLNSGSSYHGRGTGSRWKKDGG